MNAFLLAIPNILMEYNDFDIFELPSAHYLALVIRNNVQRLKR